MATRGTCECYERCGFVDWRASGVNLEAIPLPADGDCGIEVEACHRNASGDNEVIRAFGPKTYEEMVAGLPLIKNTHGRPPKRIVGGGHL